MAWITFELYSAPLYAILALGCGLWFVVYGIVIRNLVRNQFVEIPFVGVCGNLAWELVWGGFFHESVAEGFGRLFALGYALWLVIDVVISYGVLRYGQKQFAIPGLSEHFKLVCVGAFVAFFTMFYSFAAQGLDLPGGTITAYLDNLVLSAVYVCLVLVHPEPQWFSRAVGWLKMAGTGLVSVAVCVKWHENYFLMSMCASTLILDVLYIALHRLRLRECASAPVQRVAQPVAS